MAETVRQKIEHEIRERGPIPFSRYMEMCLYDAELGYYSRTADQFGKSGDFYTSSDVHAVFGRLLTRQFEEMWRALQRPERITVLELGPGRGLFAQDVLDWSEKKFPEFFRALQYQLAERSPALRACISSTLARHFATGKVSFQSPAAPLRENAAQGVSPGLDQAFISAPTGRKSAFETPTIVFANEFFDAFPVEVIGSEGLLQVGAENGRFVETWSSDIPAEALELLDRYGVRPEPGQRVELPLAAQRYVDDIAAALERAFMIVIDYGYTRDEQLAGRHRDTLMAYRHHTVSPDPYAAPGEQDITAHVNFTALAAAAEQNGMRVQPLITQSQFLLGIGEVNQFADAFEDTRVPQERAKVALQLKHLVTPAGMGENFHVLIASKRVDSADVEKLSGLSFGESRW